MAVRGVGVEVIERAAHPGGKMREVEVAGARVDAGPTVLTMPWVFEELFEAAGARFSDYVTLHPAEILARHGWPDGARLDLYADLERSVDAISAFATPAEGRRYCEFCTRAERIFNTLDGPFIRSSKPSLPLLLHRIGWHRVRALWSINPYATLWQALGTHFHDPRLRQLFARYSTYCGSSPYQAPATLMLVAHVERSGVWLPEGGMHAIPKAVATLATSLGVTFRYNAEVRKITTNGARAIGVQLACGERIEADAVVLNTDAGALSAGLLGGEAVHAVAPIRPRARSLSALTWCVNARTSGFPLTRHNVFFCPDYRAEFDDILRDGRPPRVPTVYVCAQDRDGGGASPPQEAERLLIVVNAPANGDSAFLNEMEKTSCEEATFAQLERCGLLIERTARTAVMTTPRDFERLFPATGGALYGRASHGWTASFRRPGSRTKLAGLYLAGGSTHPGAGVPMAAISGRLAARSLLADLASTSPLQSAAMPGGISMRSARIGATG
jgi:1-hydroxycarotenoid 3,4-desaturase